MQLICLLYKEHNFICICFLLSLYLLLVQLISADCLSLILSVLSCMINICSDLSLIFSADCTISVCPDLSLISALVHCVSVWSHWLLLRQCSGQCGSRQWLQPPTDQAVDTHREVAWVHSGRHQWHVQSQICLFPPSGWVCPLLGVLNAVPRFSSLSQPIIPSCTPAVGPCREGRPGADRKAGMHRPQGRHSPRHTHTSRQICHLFWGFQIDNMLSGEWKSQWQAKSLGHSVWLI